MPLTSAASVDLALVERNGFVESRHSGAALVLAPDGTVADRLGDASATILPRSSMKPLQALACLTAGAPLEGVRLALATASHSGTDRHVAVVRDILAAAGVGEEALACPPAWPSDAATRDELVRDRAEPARIRMNCSGKHAAMLLTCATNGWPTDGYLDPAHPLQTHIRELVERLTGEKSAAMAVDGCGAPVYAMTLTALARAIQRVGTSSERSPFALHRSAGALVGAVRQNPWTIDGPGRPDTIMIERLGVFAKAGAEGVQVVVAPDGTTVALKILDGSGRAASAVALRLLERVGALASADVAETMSHLPLSVSGGGREVGVIHPAF
ncbi:MULTISPECIES: asparaginase [Microbacterium]|uniref:Asparaginase n=1 Tax=Microbacterium wangchenii TaxID=2541726 RepID=A0ABX5SQ15_9MICO|nr:MULTISPECIES: asparaginase [Microbacterium]MCK6066946.1 asparaginase [Microbacterium sp. EYE_512]QBR88245.1 asparaginase [Microbacterium wangchenii]TFV83634.1 asparaginase [Microbacterium sp. dk485]TXK17965.1 asparaginase [Microbacterium wangchenii]